MLSFTASFDEIQRDFLEAGIDVSAPGFYDDPTFSERESRNPDYLNNYARFVRGRQYSPEYLERAERVIRVVGDVLEAELVKDGREGACVDLTWFSQEFWIRRAYGITSSAVPSRSSPLVVVSPVFHRSILVISLPDTRGSMLLHSI